MNFAASLVRSVKPRPGVCTVSSDDATVVTCTDDGAERVTDLPDVMKDLSTRNAAVGWAKARSDVPTSSNVTVETWWARRKNAFAHPTAAQRMDSAKRSSNLPRDVLLHAVGHVDQPAPGLFQERHHPIDILVAGQRNLDLAVPLGDLRVLLERIGFRQRLVDLAGHGRPRRDLPLQLLDFGLEPADLGVERGAFVGHRVTGPAGAIPAAGRYRAGAGVEPQHAFGDGRHAVAAVFAV